MMTMTEYMTTTHEFDAQHTERGEYYDATYTIDWVLEDVGIGEYEFWGSLGTDCQMEWVPQDLLVDEFTVYSEWPANDAPITTLKGDEVYLDNPWIEDIEGWCWYHAERLDGPE
jgi:hypothetical protein